MKFTNIDKRYFKRIDKRSFYGNQYVFGDQYPSIQRAARKMRTDRRAARANRKKITTIFKALCILLILSSVGVWKTTQVVYAAFHPVIISPIPNSLIGRIHTVRIVPSPTPTGIPVVVVPTTPVKHQATPSRAAVTPTQIDNRVYKLSAFLKGMHSPFADKAQLIVSLADQYAIDYTMISAISGKESSFGKNIQQNSYNAWGVMAWDKTGKRFIRSFKSWEEGITFESELIGKNYKLQANQAIGSKYCPKFECSNTWAQDVTDFSNAINGN